MQSLLLKDCVNLAVAEGRPVIARELQKRFAGDLSRIEDQLKRLAESGLLSVRRFSPAGGRAPFNVYFPRHRSQP